MSSNLETATLAGGCFWCLEAVFEQLQGVQRVVSGYAGGHVPHPSYEQVCGKDTGHAEVVQITFDPQVISFADLLDVFFATHDPTTLNRQGNDVGTQYRSVIFHHDEAQRLAAERMKRELDAAGVFPRPIVTQIVPFVQFFPAEDYHQDYFASNPTQPYCQMVIAPKLAKIRKELHSQLRTSPGE